MALGRINPKQKLSTIPPKCYPASGPDALPVSRFKEGRLQMRASDTAENAVRRAHKIKAGPDGFKEG